MGKLAPRPALLQRGVKAMALLKAVNLALRFSLELALLGALGWIGFQYGDAMIGKITLAILVPLVAAIVWGLFVAPRASITVPLWAWLAIQMLLFGLAVAGLATLGQQLLASILA